MNKELEFVVEEVVTVRFGDGHVVGHAEKLEEKMNNQDYLLNLWYFKRGYGLAEHLVGTTISFETKECVEEEITRLIESGWLVDAVYSAEKIIEEREQG